MNIFKQILCGLLLFNSSLHAMEKTTSSEETLIKTGQLLQASIDREAGAVYRLIQEGALVNYQDKNGASIVFHAAKIASVCNTTEEWEFSIAVLSHLLRAKANPNLANNEKETPLLALARRAHYAKDRNMLPKLSYAVSLLIKHEARLDAQDQYGSTAFDCVPEEPYFEDIKNRLMPKPN